MGASDRRTRGLIVIGSIAVAIAGLVACNQILQTDKFSDGEDTPADASSPDGTVVDGSTPDGSMPVDASFDSSFDGTIPLPPGANPATWAQWQMPDSVTDAAPAPSYTAVDAGVIDNVTHLTWRAQDQALGGGSPTFATALMTCATDKTGGFTWRLPTRIELVSLLEHVDVAGDIPEAGTPLIDTTVFDISPGTYWTSSPVLPAETTQKFWLVNFTDGSLTQGSTAKEVLCVRAK